jgi:heterotetrameric sarcosine oxidase gamma subunit
MAEEWFPLAALMRPGRDSPAAGAIGVTLSERRPGAIVEIATWHRSIPTLAAVAGLAELPPPGRLAAAPGRLFGSLAPGRWLAIAQDSGLAERLRTAIPADEGAVTDITHARVGLRLAGPSAEPLLQKGLSFDIAPSAFVPKSVAQSGIHHMGVTVLRLDPSTFDVYVASSFAGSLWDWVSEAAIEFGWRIGPPQG